MKLGKREKSRWEELAKMFGEFEELLDRISFSAPQPKADPVSPDPDQEDREESPAVLLREDALTDEAPVAPELEEATLECDSEPIASTDVADASQSFPTAIAFFGAVCWKEGSDEPYRPNHNTASRPSADTASRFFSQAPWSAKDLRENKITGQSSGLEKLMEVATKQAIISARSDKNGTSVSSARVFFSSVPWKQNV